MPAKQITKLPTWFNEYVSPYVGNAPEEFYITQNVLKRIDICRDQTLPIEPGKKYYIDTEYGYDGEAPDMFLVEFEEKKVKNPHYAAQLRSYKESLERVKEWEEIKKNLPAFKDAKKEREERALYRKLKKKYENS